jgi:4-amino-4-deoxy-L-arabinose transferase-like glycosyltransferase
MSLLTRPALLALTLALNLAGLGQNGWANEYYAATVRSMTTSWHAFLYASFDPAGLQTVDKTPLALWIQAASAEAFGFGTWSLLVPQALMGVASVALVYDLVRRRFGRAAGLAGGAALALTPITVAISRHNNPDALLVLCSVAALWCVVRALEDGRTRWLVLGGLAIGLGFETKMAAALMILPGLAAAYVWVAPRGRTAALGQLAAGGAALAAAASAWPLLIALTPAGSRPWVSGTSDNSILSLIMGYNGVGRLGGQAGGPAAGAGGPGGVFGDEPGLVRLVGASLGGQAGWLLGLAIAAGLALVVVTRLRRGDPRTGWLIAVGGAFAACAIAFSAARGIFHPYYVSLLAPFTAALAGAAVGMARDRAPVAAALVVAGVLGELLVLRDLTGAPAWAAPLVAVAGAVAVLVLINVPRLRGAAVAVAVAALLAPPASWSLQTLGHATAGTFPAGGPAAGLAGGGMFGRGGDDLASAVAYVAAQGGGAIGVASQSAAAGTIVESGAAVAGLGGFSGSESEVRLDWVADAVADGRLRWIYDGGSDAGPMRGDGRVGGAAVMAAASEACAPVAAASVAGTLYDCRGLADELRAAA